MSLGGCDLYYMNLKIFLIMLLIAMICYASPTFAGQSIITQSEGVACGENSSNTSGAEKAALADAEKKARENVLAYIKEQTADQNLRSNLLSLYEQSSVKVINEISKGWDKVKPECYNMIVQAEVVPTENTAPMKKRGMKVVETVAASSIIDSPSAPLNVNVWTDKSDYSAGEKVKISLKGNKPFYVRVVYKDAGGNLVQLLPNPFRGDNFFYGGTLNYLPSQHDRFELEVGAPFGQEEIVVYASTAPLGEIDVKPAGTVYEVKMAYADIGRRTRGVGGVRTIPLASTPQSNVEAAQTERPREMVMAEFSESSVTIKTRE